MTILVRLNHLAWNRDQFDLMWGLFRTLLRSCVRLIKAFGCNIIALTREQPAHATLRRSTIYQTCRACLRVVPRIILRLCIGADITLIISQHNLVCRLTDQVVRHHGNLAAAARRINDISWYGIAGGMAAQRLHNLDAGSHRRAEVPCALHQITLVEVVGSHSIHNQLVTELL